MRCLIIDHLGTVNYLVVTVLSHENMPVHVPAAHSGRCTGPIARRTQRSPHLSAQRRLWWSGREISAEGWRSGCFCSNLCKWACLHCAGFLCEPGVADAPLCWTTGAKSVVYRAFSCTWHWQKCMRKTGVCTWQGDREWKSVLTFVRKPFYATHHIVSWCSTTAGLA